MRPDMGKCIIERPRRGSSTPSVKARAYGKFVIRDGELDYEGLTRLPVSQKGAKMILRDCKDFSDVLGPLHNYLRSQCGRLWDDVYSEIARIIGRSAGWGVQHILKAHLEVATCTYRGVDGNVWICDKHGVSQIGGFHHDFHVEPETGILRESTGYRKWRSLSVPRYPKPPIEEVRLSDRTEYRKINGIWYYQEYDEIEYKYCVRNTSRGPIFEYRKLRSIKVKRQLSKRQLRDAKLQNIVR